MSSLRSGDLVLTATGYEPVLGFLHANTSATFSFVEIATEDGGVLPCTPEHLIFLADGSSKPAREVREGDVLSSGRVEQVRMTQYDDGYYSPITPSGTITVGGAIASTHAHINSIPHWLSQLVLAPVRWCGGVSSHQPSSVNVDMMSCQVSA